MSAVFHIVASPTPEELARVARLQPDDVFITPGCAAGYGAQGFIIHLAGLQEGGEWICGCLALLRKGRFTRKLELPWLPPIPQNSPFWAGLLDACRKMHVWDLEIRRAVPFEEHFPDLAPVVWRHVGREFRLALKDATDIRPTSENHRRNLTRATKLGMQIQKTTDIDAVAIHLNLMDASKLRRLARDGGDEGQARESYFRAMLQGGAGEFFQAVMNGVVRSSVFVLRAPKGAYYQSAGTSQEGMSEGASPFLIVRTAAQLQSEGVTCFDLGGAMDVNEGLCRFKAGFGAVAHEFEEAEFVVAPPLLRKLRTGASILRRNPGKAFSQLLNIQQTYAYAVDPATVAKQSLHEEPTEMRLEKLSDERLLELCGPGTEFSRQGERLRELGYNEAYAFFQNEELVHVSWLVTSVHDRSSIAEDLQLKAGEAEITHCYTASQWRGRGVYPKAVRLLCGEAASMGIRRLYMVTSSQNTSSQRGILKAGLKPCGRIVRVRVPALLGERALSLSTPRLRS